MTHSGASLAGTAFSALLWLNAAGLRALAQDDVAGVHSQELRAGGDEHKRYFLVGPNDRAKEPKSGFNLLIVMPGRSGDAEFHPFVKRIYENSFPAGYLIAQPVAVKWTASQAIVWPTAKNKVEG